MYKLLIKPIFFLFQPEKIHHFVFKSLKVVMGIPGLKGITKAIYQVKDKSLEREVFGIKFPNPVGLAAGFDKDAKLYEELGCLGFGFVEIGTLTPKPQPGNPQPRLFRLPQDDALINRMGFNNQGVLAAVERLKRRNSQLIIGGNIGKNKVTPNEEATSDYLFSFNELYDVVDYFVVNVSSPNTPNLRALQEKGPLTELLQTLKNEAQKKDVEKPILLKIAPDLTPELLDDIIDIVKTVKIAGVIATNTTIDRSGLTTNPQRVEEIGAGGVSGKPVRKSSTEIIKYLYKGLGEDFPIIGVGGIHSGEDAKEKLDAGAKLVQVYTGFIYEGPALMKKINKHLIQN